jgi:flagellin-like protein
MLKKHLRKGVSPIIAVLLLILIAIAAGVMTYAFVAGWIGSTTKTTTVAQGQLAIDFAELDVGAGTAVIYVRNIGGVPVTINNIYVEDTSGSLMTLYSTSISLNPGNVATISFSISGTGISDGDVYTIRVVAEDGSTAVVSVRAHS